MRMLGLSSRREIMRLTWTCLILTACVSGFSLTPSKVSQPSMIGLPPTRTYFPTKHYPYTSTISTPYLPSPCLAAESDENTEGEAPLDESTEDTEESAVLAASDEEEAIGWKAKLGNFKRRLIPATPDDGLTFRQRLAKAGLSVLLSYGWVSNASFAVTWSLAWYIHCKRTMLSPLVPGQWKNFLAVYAGFYVFNSIIRPIRFGLALSVSLYFDRLIKSIQDKLKVNKALAIALTVFVFNVIGTTSLFALGISIASAASGVPIFPPKA